MIKIGCTMKRYLVTLLFLLPTFLIAQPFQTQEIKKWKQQAKNVTIIRDNFGIPHIYGKTDADAVFGLMYAQCEDDFQRVEMNYIDKLGRLSEVNGPGDVYNDLLTRLVIDSAAAINDYNHAPVWLQKLCDAFAAGINYYLALHPEVKPKLLTRFYPWYPLLWTDGSIGAISTAGFDASDLEDFYAGKGTSSIRNTREEKPIGSNGFAFAPSITESGNAMLYINPHVTFYFRPEVHMVSEEGLNAYGAVTWGQFFVYQGFNPHCGWMHTSSYVDVSDAYLEKIRKKNGKLMYQYDGKELPVKEKKMTIRFSKDGAVSQKEFTTYFTGHGPVFAKQDDNWISVKSNNRDINGLIQSWKRTKATSFEEYKSIMNLLANTSNNTVYADAEGNIAYWHGNFIPKRDMNYDWNKPVDGTTSATEWRGLHTVNESVHLYNPKNGWIQNCNSTPFTAVGDHSPHRTDFPRYMAPDEENFRGINAVRILSGENNYTLEKVIQKGYDRKLMAFDVLIPGLIKAYDGNKNKESYSQLKDVIPVLQKWDFQCGNHSVATTLAVHWGEKILPSIYQIQTGNDDGFVEKTMSFSKNASAASLLDPLVATIKELQSKFGKWNIEWGDVNRFQRISGDIENHFDDGKSSFSVPFASSLWGMLPSYNSKSFPGTKKRYGVSGNSFVCAVEFGKTIKAKSLLAGGESGDARSPHFFDQGKMYAEGIFKDVLFYKDDVISQAEKTYHPGEE